MYAFFQEHLNHPGDPTDLDVGIFEEEELWITETGQLSTSLKGETLYSLNKVVVEDQVANLESSRLDSEKHLAAVVSSARKMSGFDYPEDYQRAVFAGRYDEEEYVLEEYLIPGSGDFMLPIALFMPPTKRKNEVFLVLDERGMDKAAKKDSLVDAILQGGKSVLLFDVAGIGSLGPGYLKGDAYIDSTSFNQWFAGILTNKSLVGIRAQDILRIITFLKTEIKGVHSISVIGSGAVCSELLHAAVFDATVQKIALIQPFLSFAEIALSPRYSPSFIPSTVAGAINKYDLPDLIAALSPRKVLIVDPLAADGSVAEESKISDLLAYPAKVFAQMDAEDNLVHLTTSGSGSFIEPVLKWLE